MVTEILKNNKLNLKLEKKKYLYRENISNKLLKELGLELNALHSINWSFEAWRVFLGPWVLRYVFLLHEYCLHYKNLEKADEIKFIKNIDSPKNFTLTFNDLNEFSAYFENNLRENKFFSRIKELNEKKIVSDYIECAEKNEPKNIVKKNYFRKIKLQIYKFLERVFCYKNDIVFYKVYIGSFFSVLKMFYKLKQVPFKYNYLEEKPPQYNLNNEMRKKIKIKKENVDYEEKILRHFLVECMPKNYIEGFKIRLTEARNNFFPKAIKFIYSCNIFSDYLFKYWTADQVNNGAKIIYGQHGANYHAFLHDVRHEHELNISDIYLSWGWRGKSDKIKPCCMFLASNKNVHAKKQNNKILFLPGIIIHPVEPVLLRTFNKNIFNALSKSDELTNFFDGLKKESLNKIYVKPHPAERKIKLKEILKKYKELKFLDKKLNPFKIAKDYALILFSNLDSTAFYQFISLNKPCVVIVDNCSEILKEEYKKEWKDMLDAKVFHETSDSLIKFIDENKDILSWWDSPTTKKAVTAFRLNNCKYENDISSNLCKEIKNFKLLTIKNER